MKILQVIVICTAAIARSKSAKNDGDSGKPYEFGFTIDGEQHRYEKRDANGIIQGEFGFITADGIYHVTTYATDENGSFRILSMRNVRISDPLDGSGGTYSNKVPASSVQGAGNKPQKIQQPLVSHQQLQQTPPPVHQNQFSSSAATTGFTSSVNPLIQTTTKRTPINFTLQSSVLPACASCGYVTRAPSTKKPVGQFAQSPNESYRPPQNRISHASLTFPAGTSSKTTTASPFIVSTTIPQTSSVNNYKLNAYAPNINAQQRPVQSIPQLQPIPQTNLITQENHHNTQNPSQSISFIPTQSFPSGPPQVPQLSNNPSQISTYDPSQISSPEKPSQFVEPPAFSPQQQQIQSNIDILNPASVPSAPIIYPHEPPQPLNNPPQISSFVPSLSSPAGPSQFSPETPIQSVGSPNFNPQQPPIDVFNPESAPLTPIAQVQNDRPQLPVNTFARPPINNQPEFDKNIPSRASDIKVENGMIYVPNNSPIKIQDKYPGMVDGLPEGIEENDIVDLLYKFNYTVGFHGHYEKGWRNGTKVGGYFVNGRDGISRVVTYVADENGYRPKFRLINLGLESPDTPKEDTEKKFGLKNFEFVWYPLK